MNASGADGLDGDSFHLGFAHRRERPADHAAIRRFPADRSAHADALYILGDLFESWVGDDAPDTGQQAAIAAIRALTSAGVPCFVMHGNRDFLLGTHFCTQSGARLLG